MVYVFVKICLSEGGLFNLYSFIIRFILKLFDDMIKVLKLKGIFGELFKIYINFEIIFC